MKKQFLAGAAASALAIALGALPAAAQQAQVQNNDGESIQLETVQVTGESGDTGVDALATREETVLTTRTDRAELDARQINDIRDIDRIAPGVSFSESSQSFNIRGLDRNRVLTTIDGIRLPWIEDGARSLTGGVSGFNFGTLSTLDIVKGSDSSVFGSGGIGGVVALRTLEPEDLIRQGDTWGGLSRLTFDSRDRSIGADQAIAGRVGNTSFLFQGGYRRGNELENTGTIGGFGEARSEKEPADFDQGNLLVKLRQHVDGGHVFGVTGEIFDRDTDIDDYGASQGLVDPDTYLPGSVRRNEINKRQRISAEYRFEGDGWVDAAEAVVYWQRQQIENGQSGIRRTPPIGDYSRLTEREETTFGVNGSALKIAQINGMRHAFSFGGEIYGSRASSYSSGQDNCGPGPFPPFHSCNFLHTNQADMPEVDGITIGLFVQDEIRISDTFRLTPGLRFDWYEQKPQNTAAYEDNPNFRGLPPASSDSAISPKLRAEWDVREKTTLYAQYNRGFRAPSANELYLDYGGPGTYLRLGDPNLEPETSHGIEIGANLGDENFGGSLAGFYNRYKNFIDAVGVSPASVGLPPGMYPFGITQTINRASVEIWGVEGKIHYRHATGWHGWATAGYYEGHDRDTGDHLNSIPAFKAVGSIGYATDIWGTDLIVTGVAKRDKAESPDNVTGGYGVVDLTAWWSPRAAEGLTLRAGIYNIFDKKYVDALNLPDAASTRPKAYFSDPGRSVKVSATYQF